MTPRNIAGMMGYRNIIRIMDMATRIEVKIIDDSNKELTFYFDTEKKAKAFIKRASKILNKQ